MLVVGPFPWCLLKMGFDELEEETKEEEEEEGGGFEISDLGGFWLFLFLVYFVLR